MSLEPLTSVRNPRVFPRPEKLRLALSRRKNRPFLPVSVPKNICINEGGHSWGPDSQIPFVSDARGAGAGIISELSSLRRKSRPWYALYTRDKKISRLPARFPFLISHGPQLLLRFARKWQKWPYRSFPQPFVHFPRDAKREERSLIKENCINLQGCSIFFATTANDYDGNKSKLIVRLC